jgi:Mn-dependent DtxR family transcriptional regulator
MVLRSTPSQENYLEHIGRLSGKGPVRSVDIAGSAGVKRPSVNRAVNTLMSMGLVKHELYKGIELTHTGYRTAQFIAHMDRCLKLY